MVFRLLLHTGAPILCQQRQIFACSIALAFCIAQLRDSGMIEISVRSLECAVLECPHLIGHHSGHQRYPNILDILRYCDPGWTHKSNWIINIWVKHVKKYARSLPRVYAIFCLPLNNQPRLNTQQHGAREGAGQAYFLYMFIHMFLSNLICESIHDHNIIQYPIFGCI